MAAQAKTGLREITEGMKGEPFHSVFPRMV
jgi:hypothetical protein